MERRENDLALEVIGLQLSFNGLHVLDGLGIEIRRGQILSVIGPNGAGKTSLVNCITGYYRPQQGRVFFRGQNILRLKPHQVAGFGISRTFQNPTTYPNMTALDILMAARYVHTRTNIFNAMLYFGKSRREELESRRIAEEIIAFAQIEELRNKPVATMSYGQRKQVEIARALTMQPEVILLDEPMSGLDDVMKEIVTELILKVYERGVTIVLVEHDMQTVMDLSHSIVVLDYGRKIAEGTPEEIGQDTNVVSAYVGELAKGENIKFKGIIRSAKVMEEQGTLNE